MELDCKKYESFIVHKGANSQIILEAIDIVKEFIIDKQLILYGGQSIDFALRLKGDYIYTDDVIPDYDFYSFNHFNDAYELGLILFNYI